MRVAGLWFDRLCPVRGFHSRQQGGQQRRHGQRATEEVQHGLVVPGRDAPFFFSMAYSNWQSLVDL